MTANSILETVLEYREGGLTCLPCKAGTKKISLRRWKQYQHGQQTEVDIQKLFNRNSESIAVLCGPPSGNLCVFDFEDKHRFNEFAYEFERRFGTTWMADSRRGGHVYVRLLQSMRGFKDPLMNCEVRGVGQYVMAPPSPHPQGGYYEFRSKPAHIAEIDLLDLQKEGFLDSTKLAEALERPARDSDMRRNLGEAMDVGVDLDLAACLVVFERVNQHRERYQTRSEYDQAVIQTLVNRGANFSSVLAAFRAAQLRSTPSPGRASAPRRIETSFARRCREHGEKRAIDYLQRSYLTAIARPHTPAMQAAAARASRLRECVEMLPWTARNFDRLVLHAHIDVYERCGRQPWTMSVREVADLARIDPATASRCTGRLLEAGLLIKVAASYWNCPASYDFGPRLLQASERVAPSTDNPVLTSDKSPVFGPNFVPTNLTLTTLRPVSPHLPLGASYHQSLAGTQRAAGATKNVSVCCNRKLLSTPVTGSAPPDTCGVFQRAGFGEAAHRVWQSVLSKGLSQCQIVIETGLAKGTVSKAVVKLCRHQVLDKDGKIYRANHQVDFAALAKRLGLAGTDARRQFSHSLQRDEYVLMLRQRRQRNIAKRGNTAGRRASKSRQ